MEKLRSPIPSREDNALDWKKQFLGPLDNNSGQSLMTGLILLSTLLILTVSMTAAMSLIQDRMHMINLCRIETLKTQSLVEPLIKRLFSLNPQAKMLRLLMLAARARLASAIAHYNVPMAARARYDISQIRQKQQLLDETQKALIKSANFTLYTGTYSTYVKLQKSFTEIKNRSKNFADINFFLQNPKVPQLAVKPEDYNLAPTYLAKDDFEKRQSISQTWSQTYKIKGFFKTFHQSQSQCHTTLEENTWVPKIRKDKLFSKWR